MRSLNLANVVCLGLYTALSRTDTLPTGDGTYVAHPDAAVDVRPVDRIQPNE